MKRRLKLLRERWAALRSRKEYNPVLPAAGLFRGSFVAPPEKKRRLRPKKSARQPLPFDHLGAFLHDAHKNVLWVSMEDERRVLPWMPRPKRRRKGEHALTKISRKLKRGMFAWREMSG